ncbi:MAG TPA: helix-turn-helix domain-containing protein [Candidatus Dormibacteraeota bacterium]|jgi:sugar-specific transcriptional regulator TrmB|nr:helix-turn-helix domain-containing protein [Candidatus Dormibacteraeota bacterium]
MGEPPDSEIADQMVGLGLNQYEARTYVGLLRRQASTAGEMARLTGVPRQRIYDVLDGLVEKGLAAVRPGRTAQYAAVEPALALEGLVGAHRQRLAAAEASAESLLERLRPAYHEGQAHTDPLDYIEVLRDQRAIAQRFNDLLDATQREILVFTKPPYAVTVRDNVRGLDVARRRTMRSIYELSAFDDPEFPAAVQAFAEAGEQIRFVAELPLKLGIIDETIVMFGMADPVAEPSGTTVVIEHPALARILKIAFEAVWDTSLEYGEALATRRARALSAP